MLSLRRVICIIAIALQSLQKLHLSNLDQCPSLTSQNTLKPCIRREIVDLKRNTWYACINVCSRSVSQQATKFHQHVLNFHINVLLQTMATVPDGVRDIAIANSSKNRYQNIHTCESGNNLEFVAWYNTRLTVYNHNCTGIFYSDIKYEMHQWLLQYLLTVH